MAGNEKVSKELQAYVEASRPLTYAEYCRVKYGRPGPGLPPRGSPGESALQERYLARMGDSLSELQVYYHESENEFRRDAGFGPLRPGDPADVLVGDRKEQLLSALAAVRGLRRDRRLSAAEVVTVLDVGGSVAGVAVSRPQFDRTLPKLPTTSLEVTRAMAALGRAVLECRPDLHRELLRRYGEEWRHRVEQRERGPLR